jgi:hypothetical protein
MENFIRRPRQTSLNACGCGQLHFTYGPITLHFEREEFLTFAEVVGRLAAQIPLASSDRKPVTRASGSDGFCH